MLVLLLCNIFEKCVTLVLRPIILDMWELRFFGIDYYFFLVLCLFFDFMHEK